MDLKFKVTIDEPLMTILTKQELHKAETSDRKRNLSKHLVTMKSI